MAIIVAGKTDIGKKRKTNQDAILMLSEKKFFVVADGMGGHNGGDIASQMAVAVLSDKMQLTQDKEPGIILRDAVISVNQEIFKRSKAEPDLKGMGTTVTAIWFFNHELLVANIGDSRTYLVNHARLYQLSRDHSLVQEKLDLGIYDRNTAQRDPQKNVLVRTVGYEGEVSPDVFHYKVSKNDIFIQCSDGLHGKVSEKDILAIVNDYIPNPELASVQDLEKTVEKLIDQANQNGGNDNISVIMTLAQEK